VQESRLLQRPRRRHQAGGGPPEDGVAAEEGRARGQESPDGRR